MSIQDERVGVWSAIETNGARITKLETEMIDTVTKAVKAAMPVVVTDDEHRFLKNLIARQEQNLKFRTKVIESSAIWAVPLMILAVLAVFREYAIVHGMWRP